MSKEVNIVIAENTEEEFEWIYKLHGANSNLLGAPYPAAIRQDLYRGRILTTEDKLGFCQFTAPNRNPYVTVHTICTKEEARGKHIASKMVTYLKDKYKVPVRAVCETGTISEKFWQSQGKKIGDKFSKKGTPLSIFECGENRLHEDKVELF